MNYHIITQDTFFDAYIEDFYKLHQEDDNVFLVRGECGESPRFTSKRKVEFLGNDRAAYINRLSRLKSNDKLFVSWYDLWLGEIIIESKIETPLYVLVMGGDFYADPFWFHAHWLFDKQTYVFVKKNYDFPTINWLRRPHNWYKIFNDIRARVAFKKQQCVLYERKLNTMKRINYIVLPKQAVREFEHINELYPGCDFKMAYGAYDQNYDKAIQYNYTLGLRRKPLKVLIGNSADTTNNYLDAFVSIRRYLNYEYEIYSSLSYGDEINKKNVITNGNSIFGDRFHPIIDFMTRDEYIAFLSTIDVVVMYHNRQQACGNIMTSLVLGKPVFLKPQNPVYSMLKSIGISSIYDVNELRKVDVDKIIVTAYNDRLRNAQIIAEIYSEETRLNYWRQLIEMN